MFTLPYQRYPRCIALRACCIRITFSVTSALRRHSASYRACA